MSRPSLLQHPFSHPNSQRATGGFRLLATGLSHQRVKYLQPPETIVTKSRQKEVRKFKYECNIQELCQ